MSRVSRMCALMSRDIATGSKAWLFQLYGWNCKHQLVKLVLLGRPGRTVCAAAAGVP